VLQRVFTVSAHHPRILLLEPNAALRRAVVELLDGEGYPVEECESLEVVVQRANGRPSAVALVAWQSMEGLLADEHRHHLAELTRRVRLVLMVPRRWQRLLDKSELGFADLVPKPFSADELLECLTRLAGVETAAPADSSQAAAASD
jgi:DNA-binding response OmpR family regulator